MKKYILWMLSLSILFSSFGFCALAEEIDPLQKFFVYSLHLDGDSRVHLVDFLKEIQESGTVTEENAVKIAALFPEMNMEEIKRVLVIFKGRSQGNQNYIQDLILFGVKEMPYKDKFPTISASFNQYIIGNAADNRGINYFSTLIAAYRLYSIFGGDPTIAKNHELPGLIMFFIADNMPADVVEKISGALQYMPNLKSIISEYTGASALGQMFAFAEQLINECSSEEIYYFKWAMDELGVFEGSAGSMDQNKKYKGLSFRDLDLFEWAIPQIRELVNKGIVSGLSQYVFAPSAVVTREQFVKLIVEAFDLKGEKIMPFTDVDSTQWYYSYLSAAYANNVVQGESEDSFGIGSSISREQMATMMYRVCMQKGITFAKSDAAQFADRAQISGYAKAAVDAMASCQIIRGVGDNQFAPLSMANRAQAAVMIFNVLQYAGMINP